MSSILSSMLESTSSTTIIKIPEDIAEKADRNDRPKADQVSMLVFNNHTLLE